MKTSIFVLTLFLLGGCNLKGSSGGNQSGTETELTGTWRVACHQTGPGSFLKHIIVFGTSDVTSTEEFYGDTMCTLLKYTRVSTGTYSILGSSAAIASGKELNFDYTELSITANTQDMVNQFIGLRTCDTTNWTVGIEVDCSDLASTLYQVYQLVTNNLTFGLITATYDGTTSAKRPRSIDPLKIYLIPS